MELQEEILSLSKMGRMNHSHRTIALTLVLMFVTANVGAQSSSTKVRVLERGSGTLSGTVIMDPGKSMGNTGRAIGAEGMMGPRAAEEIVDPRWNDRYEKNDYKDLQQQLDERAWNNEDTAWERASSLGTKEAFQRYIGMYPLGIHLAEAQQHIIDIDIENVLNNPHADLPGFRHVRKDEESDNSTITIHNSTGTRLHILFSGEESKDVYIPRGGETALTVSNGNCKIAALVDDPKVTPFAGKGYLEGGEYEVTFYINKGNSVPPPDGWLRHMF